MNQKETLWFPHDYEPTSDPKMQAMISDFGGVGYGIYWRIVEMLHSDSQHKLPNKPYIFKAIANQMLPNVKQMEAIAKQDEADKKQADFLPENRPKIAPWEYIKGFVGRCTDEYELFAYNDDFFWSDRVNRNIEKKNKISATRSLSGKKGGQANAKQNQANAKQDDSNGKQNRANGKQTRANEKQNQADKIRVDKKREEDSKDSKGLNSHHNSQNTALSVPQNIGCEGNVNSENTGLSNGVLAGRALAEMGRRDDIPAHWNIETESQRLSDYYTKQGKPVNDIEKVVSLWIQSDNPKHKSKLYPDIKIEGKTHKAELANMKTGEYYYPTITGKEFSEDRKSVLLIDGTWQELGKSQLSRMELELLSPNEIKKGFIN